MATLTADTTGEPTDQWWPLDEPTSGPLPPLLLGLLRTERQAFARTLTLALDQPDLGDLSQRLLGQPEGRPAMHATHLTRLTAPLSDEQRWAFQQALGVCSPATAEEVEVPVPPRRVRLNSLPLPSHPPLDLTGHPASSLTTSLRRFQHSAYPISAYNAAEGLQLLRRLTRHWLEDRHVLHLELISGLSDPQSIAAHHFQAAQQHALTTLTGARRQQLKAMIQDVRLLHVTLRQQRADLDDLRRAALRAALRAARELVRGGHLNRIAEARWLDPWELRDALDGTLNPRDLLAVVAARQAQYRSTAPTLVTFPSAQAREFQAVPLAPGVRDGVIRRFDGGSQSASEAVLLLDAWPNQHAAPWSEAHALLLPQGTLLSRRAAQARETGQPVLSLQGRQPDWLQPGVLVRVNGHSGTITLLRPAGASGSARSSPFDLNLSEGQVQTPAGLTLDMDWN